MENNAFHEPVMLRETVESLHINKNSKVIDATLGLGGHTIEILKKGSKVLGIEADENTLEIARANIKKACPGDYDDVSVSYKLVHGNFRYIDKIAKENNFTGINAIIADLGISSYQLTRQDMGLSFNNLSSPLDMRIDKLSTKVTASDLLNLLDEKKLTKLFAETLSFGKARNLAKKVVDYRTKRRFETVGDFLDLLDGRKKGRLHPATLPFLALRIIVNSELANLEEFLPKAYELLKKSGILAVITFHSGEDRLVKHFINEMERREDKVLENIVIYPSILETKRNPRSRSAKLRILKKHD